MMTRLLQVAAAATAILVGDVAIAADYSAPAYEEPAAVDDDGLPLCGNPKVFKKIAGAFEDKESEYWNSDLVLISFDDPVELGYRSWGPEFIPRRFCSARTYVSDGSDHSVFYSVGKDTGTLGIKWGVEWCVSGLDRNLAYAPDCRMAQP